MCEGIFSMIPILIAGPAVEPLALDEMRAFLRLDDSGEDDLVAALIRAARQCVEAASGCVMIAQTWRIALDLWPVDHVVSVPLSPLISIEAIRVFDAAGLTTVLAPALYRVDAAFDPARILIDAAAAAPGRSLHGVEIDVCVGYGTLADAVPEPLRHAIRIMVARWFENRGDAADPSQPLAADLVALLAPFRRARL
jgi:uncharacterized phiE125 gp8 family phage protein